MGSFSLYSSKNFTNYQVKFTSAFRGRTYLFGLSMSVIKMQKNNFINSQQIINMNQKNMTKYLVTRSGTLKSQVDHTGKIALQRLHLAKDNKYSYLNAFIFGVFREFLFRVFNQSFKTVF